LRLSANAVERGCVSEIAQLFQTNSR
jgi:hypothetical protein